MKDSEQLQLTDSPLSQIVKESSLLQLVFLVRLLVQLYFEFPLLFNRGAGTCYKLMCSKVARLGDISKKTLSQAIRLHNVCVKMWQKDSEQVVGDFTR